uniref:Egl-9 family hypoxia inducible factor 1 n=1 Tax=Oryzias sinensis TaxID=183150 RepID=A0A8C8A4V2_9TELE
CELDLDRDRQYCELCGKMENLLKCGRCRSSFYCSKEHQKQHWKKHKLICKEVEKPLPLKVSSSLQKLALEVIVPCMNTHGICVVNGFLGEETGLSVLGDVKALYETGKFTDGQLVSQKSDSTRDIRGDKIAWIEGREPGCEKIQFLMGRMDDLIRHCNGNLGNYTINGRTKVSISPGEGAETPDHARDLALSTYFLRHKWDRIFLNGMPRNAVLIVIF